MGDLAAALREAGHEDVAAALDKKNWPVACASPAATTWPTRSQRVTS
jgi:hypothetical protein